MLKVKATAKFKLEEAKKLAEELGVAENFQYRLNLLDKWGGDSDVELSAAKDPHCFWLTAKDMTGELIFNKARGNWFLHLHGEIRKREK